ncbi:tetratricopeptide repeat protein [Dactylosporangium sp. CA-233914]|uniref:tetratricopeptide repeat protein n=1 Tax=Dactylosporangium sp. CA-233914 TaxID=3239934 RepID=UPI003D8DF7EB
MEQFFARDEEQDRFVIVLQHALEGKGEPDEGFLIIVQGHGGIGKTELLTRFAAIVRGKVRRAGVSNRFTLSTVDWSDERSKRPSEYASWAGPPILVVLDTLYEQLRDGATGWWAQRGFKRGFAAYRAQALKMKQAQPATASPGRLPEIVGATVGAVSGLVGVPGLPAASEKVAAGVTQAVQDARRRAGDRDYDASAEDALVRAFAAGVRAMSGHRPMVFILDTAEILGEARRYVRDVARRSGQRTVWVWGIRLEDEANAAEDSETMLLRRQVDNARLRLVPLSRFDDKTIRRYLESRLSGRPVTPELVTAVVALTRGIPLAVRLATNLLGNGVPPEEALREISATGEVSEVIGGLARRYLIHLTRAGSPQMQADLGLIYGLALVNGPVNDPDLLAALWQIPAAEVAARLDALAARHDFVLSGRRRMHQEIRRTIRLFLLDPVRRPEVRAANERAVKALQERMAKLVRTPTVEAQLADEEWRAAADQLLWHTFWVSIRDGMRLLAELMPAAHTLAPALAADLLRTARWFEPVFTAEQRAIMAGTRVLLPSGSTFVQRMGAEFRRAAERLNRAPTVSTTAMEVIAEAAGATSNILATDVPPVVFVLLLRLETPTGGRDAGLVAVLEEMAQTLPAAGVPRLRQAVATRVEAVARDTVSRPEDRELAVSVRQAAIRVVPGSPALHALLAEALQEAGDLEAALSTAEEACRLDPDKAELRIACGLILRDLGRHEECLAAYEEACRLQPRNPNWHVNRAIALRRLGRLEDVLAAYEEVCRLQPDVVERHVDRALALADLDRHEEVLAAFSEAVRLDPANPNWHGNRAVVLQLLGRADEALAAYEQAGRAEPDNPQRHADRADILLRLDRPEEALAAYAQAGRLDPDRPRWRVSQVEILARLQRFAEALVLCEEVCRLDPDDPRWQINRAVALLQLDRAEEALTACEEACRLEPGNGLWHVNRAVALKRLDRAEEVLAACEEACRLGPDNAEWHTRRAIELAALGRHEEALSAREAACRAAPEVGQWQLNRAVALKRLDRDEEALAACEEACRLAPGNAGWHADRAVVLDRLGRPAEALAAFEEACRIEPGNVRWHVLRGAALVRAQAHAEALEAFEEACRLEPGSPSWHVNRAVALTRLNRPEAAADAFARACRLAPDNVDWHVNWAMALSRLDQPAKSLLAFDELRRLEPGNARWHSNRGWALGRLERDEEALEAYEEACRIAPDNAQSHGGRAFVLGRLGRDEEALKAYEQACRLEPDNGGWAANRGFALGRLGRDEEALEAYDEACRIAPDNGQFHGGRASVLDRLGRDEEMLEAYATAARCEPGDSRWPSNRGIALARMRRYEESLAAIDEAVRISPGSATLLNNRGECLMLMRRDAEAAEAFRASLDLTEHLESTVHLALIIGAADARERDRLSRAALHLPDLSLSECRRAELRALAYAMLDRTEEAERELRAALAAWTRSDPFQVCLYDLLGAAGRAEAAGRLVRIWRESGVAAFDEVRTEHDQAR